jgi:hypothetical protein
MEITYMNSFRLIDGSSVDAYFCIVWLNNSGNGQSETQRVGPLPSGEMCVLRLPQAMQDVPVGSACFCRTYLDKDHYDAGDNFIWDPASPRAIDYEFWSNQGPYYKTRENN